MFNKLKKRILSLEDELGFAFKSDDNYHVREAYGRLANIEDRLVKLEEKKK